MPDLQNNPKAPGAISWFLKIDDGSVFGPVPAADLRNWAEQGRIAPGNQISKDKKSWILAEDLPDLDMRWMVQLSGDTVYGPLNIKALGDLVRDGTVSPTSVLTDRTTRRTSTVQQELPGVGREAQAPASEEAGHLKKQLDEEKAQYQRTVAE